MSNIDERIVEMKFENHLFEKNVHTSIGTLEKLKAALKFDGADKSLDNVQKSVNAMDFSKMADGIDALNKRFSTMGIAGMTVIQDLTRAAEGMLKKVYDNTLGLIKSKGWSRATNLDQAKFLIEGLGHTWEEVSDSIDYAVDHTAYGMDEAAKVAAQFLASGIAAGEQMNYSLRAISGVAAMTNSTYEEVGHIFTTVAGQGRLMGDQLNQLAIKGLNVAADLAKAFNVTEEELRDMVSKGKVSFEMFAKTMDDLYGEHAKKANETFEGSMANMKAALGRIGQKIFAPIRKEAVPVFNALREGIDTVKESLDNSGVFDRFAHFLETLSKFSVGVIGKIFGIAGNGWLTSLGTGIGDIIGVLDNGIAKFGGFFEEVSTAVDKTAKKVESAVLTVSKVDELAHRVIAGEFGNEQARWDAIDELTGIEGAGLAVQNRVNELLDCAKRYEEAAEVVDDSNESMASSGDKVNKRIHKQVKERKSMQTALDDFGKSVHSAVFETGQMAIFDWATRMLSGFISVASTGGGIVSAFVQGISGPLIEIGTTAASVFGDLTGSIADAFVSFGAWMDEVDAYEAIQTGVNAAFTFFSDIFSEVGDTFSTVFDATKGVFGKVAGALGDAVVKSHEFFSTFTQSSGFTKVRTFFSDLGSSIVETKDKFVNGIVDTFNNFIGTDFKIEEFDVSGLVASASESFNWIGDKLNEVKTDIGDFFTTEIFKEGNIFSQISDFFQNIDWSEIAANTMDKLSSIGDVIKSVFGDGAKLAVKLGGKIGKGFAAVTNWAGSLVQSARESGLLEKIQTKANEAFEGFLDIAKKAGDVAYKGFDKLIDIVSNVAKNLWNAKDKVVDFFKAFKNTSAFTKIKTGFDSIKDSILNLKDRAFTFLQEKLDSLDVDFDLPEFDVDAFAQTVSDKIDWLIERFNELKETIKQTFGFGGDGTEELVGDKVVENVNKLSEKFETIQSAASMVFSLFGNKSSTVKKATMATEQGTTGLMSTVLDSLRMFSPGLADSIEWIQSTLGGFLTSVGEFIGNDPLGAITTALSTFVSYKIAKTFIGLGKAIADVITDIPAFLEAATDGIGRVSKAMAREANTKALLNLGLALAALAGSFWLIAQIPADKFGQAVAGILILGGVLAGLMFVLGKFFGNGGKASLNPLQSLQEALASFGKEVSKSLNKIGIAGILIGFAVAITTIIGAISKIADLPIGTLIKGGLGVVAIIASLTGAVILMSKYGSDIKMGHAGTILAMAIAIKLIASAISAIGSLSDDQFLKGIEAVAVIFTGLTVVTLAASKMKDVNAKPILGIIGLLVAISGSLLVLSFIKPARLKAAANSIMKVMLSLAALTLCFNMLSKVKTGDTEHMWKAFAVITAFFAEIAGVLAAFAIFMPEDQIKKLPDIADALSEMMIGLGILAAGFGIFHAFGGGTDFGTGDAVILALGALTGIMAAIAGYVDEWFGEGTLQEIIDRINSGSELVKALGEAIGSLFNGLITGFLGFDFGEAVKEAVDDVKNLPEHILNWVKEFGPMLDEIDKLNSEHDYSDSTVTDMTRVTNFVDSIASNIASAAGHIQEIKDSGAKPEDVTNILGEWATAVYGIASTLDGVTIDEDTAGKFENVESIVSRISNISGIINGSGEGGGKLGTDQLTSMLSASGVAIKFAEDMKTYGEKIKDVDQEAVTATANAVSIITTLGRDAAQVGQDSILGQAMDGSLIGNGSIDYFADQLQPFAEGMVKYSEEIKGMVDNTDAVMGTQKAVEVITTLAGQASEIGNAMDIITTNDGFISNIQLFSSSLGDFATGMATYSQNISGMNPFAVILNKAACDMIIELSKAIPSTEGGLLAFLKGNEIDNFSTNIPKLAEGFVKFAEAAAGFQADDAKKIVDTFKTLAETADLIVEYSGATGKEPIETAVDTLAETISNAFDTLAFEGRVDETDTASLISFGENIGKNLGSGIAAGIKASDGGAEIQSALTTLFDDVSFSSEGGDTSSAFAPFVDAVTEAMTKAVTVIEGHKEQFSAGGKALIAALAAAIKFGAGTISTSIRTALSSAVNTINGYKGSFMSAGRNLSEGLAAGIRQGMSSVTRAVADVANTANSRFRNIEQEQSPSKLWAQYGNYMDQGLANGLIDGIGTVKSAVTVMAKGTNRALDSELTTMTDSLSSQLVSIYEYINSVVNSSLDSNPVITPVVDLSQVQNGMYSAGAMLSSAGTAFGAGALSYARSNFPGVYSYGSTAQGMSEAATLRALNGVRSDLKDLGNALSAMDMVLDNGVLVGQMGIGMDRQLGTIQKFKERWA